MEQEIFVLDERLPKDIALAFAVMADSDGIVLVPRYADQRDPY